jgi:hypothetical protein
MIDTTNNKQLMVYHLVCKYFHQQIVEHHAPAGGDHML